MTATSVESAPQAQDPKSAPNSKEASPVKEKTPAEVMESASQLLVTGKRNLLVSEVPSAVSVLAQACEMLSSKFGETAKECAEAYFYYGKSLLELSRMESGVLGNALDGVPEEDDGANDSKIEDPGKVTEDEKEKITDQVVEALDENAEALEKKKESITTDEGSSKSTHAADTSSKPEDDGAEKDNKEDATEEEQGEEVSSMDEGTEDEEEGTEEGTEEGKSGEEKKDDDPSNLQLAWEMLEMAKVVYTKQIESGDLENKAQIEERLCSTIISLGEVSIENENYAQAVEDLKACLSKQDSLPKDSRIVAETHYQLGVAQGYNNQFEDAVSSLNTAIKILKERIKNLKESSSVSDDVQKEIAELETLIPEIEEKIDDTKNMEKESMKKKEEQASVVTSDEKAVSAIAVKRKGEDEAVNSSKKVATEEKTAAAV